MALVAAGIANGGGIMRPWLVGSMADAEGDEVWRVEPGEWRRPVRPETAQAVARMMTWGVRQGAAGAAAIPGVEVGAKTGTAEAVEGQEPHAWFIGFAGRYAVAVVLDNAGGGGTNALPVGRELLRAAVGRA
jgi:peptidoglycan glycosyltransferase